MNFMEWFVATPGFLPNWAWFVMGLAAVIIVLAVILIVKRSKESDEVTYVREVRQEKAEPVSGEEGTFVSANTTAQAPAAAEEEAQEEFAQVETEDKEEEKVAKETTESDVKPANEQAAPAKPEGNKPTTKTYHISLRKSDGKWQVKLAGGEKAIKLFDTQLQAIDYCKTLAENQDGNIVIHKKDGSFRKLTY